MQLRQKLITLAFVTTKKQKIFIRHSEYYPDRYHGIFLTLDHCESPKNIPKNIIANFPSTFNNKLKKKTH